MKKNAAAAGCGAEGMICIGVLSSLLLGFLCEVLAEFPEMQSGKLSLSSSMVYLSHYRIES